MTSTVRKVPITRVCVAGCLVVLVGLLWSGLCGAQIQIVNPSFEATKPGTPAPRLLPSGWYLVDDYLFFDSYCVLYSEEEPDSWPTDGTVAACLLSRPGKVFEGRYQSFWQFVDLTGMGVLVFDAMLEASSGPFAHFEASVLVDDVPLWSAVVEGVYLSQEIDLSNLPEVYEMYGLPGPGWHIIELRLTALEDGEFAESYLVYWDNMVLLPDVGTIEADIDLDPDTLNLGSQGRWITCYIELPAGYDVAQIDESTVTLEEISAVTGVERWARRWSRWQWGRPWAHRWAQADMNRRTIVDHDGDGVLERVVRFDRAAVQAIVQAPETTVAIAGELFDGTPFEGTATIKVMGKPHKWK